MPNAAVLKEKQEIVAQLAEKMKSASAGVLWIIRALAWQTIQTASRSQKRRVEYSVVKNTLTKLAADQIGFSEIDEHLNVPLQLLSARRIRLLPQESFPTMQRIPTARLRLRWAL